MTDEHFRIVHDFAFHHVLQACRRNGLPVVIHTGFQIWGHASLAQANPILLHNILIDPRYRDLTFVLLHGGNPYVGETTYLAGMFPNVILDFTWIGWMTPPRFRLALAEWLATVPHDRMCWGSDCGSAETIAGIDSIMRNLIADVLEQSVASRTIDEKYAVEFVGNSYRTTSKRVFGV
jgi:predicted TIM-barrel fold metal-dependent hydrolase